MFNDDPACSNKAQNISENSIKIPTTINLSLSSGAHFNNAYNNQAPIKIIPKPPNS